MSEYTDKEFRENFIEKILSLVDYWETVEGKGNKTTKDRLEGLAFSILSTMDGSGDLPRFIVAPNPHMDDKEYHKDQDESWYVENFKSDVNCDIGGTLHDWFHPLKKIKEEREKRTDKIDIILNDDKKS